MKLILEKPFTADISSDIEIEKINDNIIQIKIVNYDFLNKKESYGIAHISKEDLSELIGGLLHVQSKFRK